MAKVCSFVTESASVTVSSAVPSAKFHWYFHMVPFVTSALQVKVTFSGAVPSVLSAVNSVTRTVQVDHPAAMEASKTRKTPVKHKAQSRKRAALIRFISLTILL